MLEGFYSYPWGIKKKTWQIGCGGNPHRNKMSKKKCEENKAKISEIVMKIRQFDKISTILQILLGHITLGMWIFLAI